MSIQDSYKSKDPFPNIRPALLNSADIEDYANVTKMIYPFYPDKLKSASYEIGFEGDVYYWDENGDAHSKTLKEGDEFPLIKNSIAFLYTKTKFNLPDYIAIRFNLKITHVHRGILLGTGPLVDPGFEGQLLIPLHNLTTNDYDLIFGEGLIWVEFTKLSENIRWFNNNHSLERSGNYKVFPENKKNKDPNYYFGKAALGRSIRSSIPDAMRKSADDAETAQKAAIKLEKRSSKIAIFGGLGILVAIIAIWISLYIGFQPILQMVQDNIQYIKNEEEGNIEQLKKLNSRIDKLEIKLQNYVQNKEQSTSNEVLLERINFLENEIIKLKKKQVTENRN